MSSTQSSMPDTDGHPPSGDLRGTWRGEVRFTAGPLQGNIHHEAWLFADDALLVHLRTRCGVGGWKVDGDRLSLAFHEVVLDDAGKPNAVVHVTSSGTLAPDSNTFEATGRGDVYGIGGELIATNHTIARGWRADRAAT